MCLAIYKPAGKAIPEEHFEEAFFTNSDGAGYTYVDDDGKVRYAKGFFTYDEFIKHYNQFVKPHHEALIHFRYATVGEKTTDNCHPFPAGYGGMMVHNGPQIRKLGDNETSDSREFAERILSRFDKEDLEEMREVLEGYLDFNKVAVLYPTGVVILNEKLGIWEDGVWYSNDGYKSYYSNWSWKDYTKTDEVTKYTKKDAEIPALFRDADGDYELSDEYLAYLLSQLDADMVDYVDRRVDLDNYFYDEEASSFFFYDELVMDYIHLQSGMTTEEYYKEILGYYFYPGADEDDSKDIAAAEAIAALWPEDAAANRASLTEVNH